MASLIAFRRTLWLRSLRKFGNIQLEFRFEVTNFIPDCLGLKEAETLKFKGLQQLFKSRLINESWIQQLRELSIEIDEWLLNSTLILIDT